MTANELGDSVGHEFAYPAYHMHAVHGICPYCWMFLFGKCRLVYRIPYMGPTGQMSTIG